MPKRIMIVLGGNAFVQPGEPLTMAGQFRFADDVLRRLLPLFGDEYQPVITHGNGPQVGQMLTRVEESLGKAYAIPLEVCVAESEGELGYVLQQSLYNVLRANNRCRPIAGLLTQVVVAKNDPAFQEPSKPIGPFYTKDEADALSLHGYSIREDAGRGYRRVVPSPAPLEIIEADVIEQMLDAGIVVVAAGGGGIPVIREREKLVGVEAVIDKDLASALLGEVLGGELMLILTGVPCAYRNYREENQEPIGPVSVAGAEELIAAGHFAPGSMLPKMEAAVKFTRRTGGRSIICDLDSVIAALAGEAGTIVES